MSQGLPEGLVRAARRGRLVVFCSVETPEVSLPAAVWLTTDRAFLPWASDPVTAAEIENGTVRSLEVGAVVEADGDAAWGTPRCPTRLRDWFERLARERAVLFVGDPPLSLPTSRQSFACGPEVLPELAGETLGARALDLPPLAAVASPRGLAAVALAATAAAGSWLAAWTNFGGAQNWLWTQLIPWVLAAGAAAGLLAPLAARAAAGVDLPAREWYARCTARWSQWPRAPIVAALLAALALGPWWLMRRHARATFIVLFEPAIVSVEGSPPLGACRAEEPCSVVAPRRAHLHFEGGDGGVCGLDLKVPGEVVFIDTQQEGCEAFLSDDEKPPTRG